MPMKDYFGTTDEDEYISFNLNGAHVLNKNDKGRWVQHSTGSMNIKGFYEEV
jgi:hypothetical protein